MGGKVVEMIWSSLDRSQLGVYHAFEVGWQQL
jgi:hypothetical protein